MIQGKLLYYPDNLEEAFYIRRKVFIEEQGISEELEMDSYDNTAVHAVVYHKDYNQKPIATGRIYFDGEECKIGRVAVLKEYRGQGYGDFVVRLLVNKALTSGVTKVILYAQQPSVNFYKKIGFIEDGDIFMEAGIPHQKMCMNPDLLCGACCKK